MINFKTLISASIVLTGSLAVTEMQADDTPTWGQGNPVEIYGCSFTDGVNGYEQSQKFAASWNQWADKQGAFGSHVAQLMWAEFSDGEYPSDFTWLGYWDNYADAGKDMDIRATNGSSIYEEANEFLEQCAHSEWGAWELLAGGDWTKSNHITEFSDCFYKEGKDDSDLLVANIAYAEELAKRGMTGAAMGSGQLWPRAGSTTATQNAVSFKWVRGYPNFAAYTAFTHALWNEGLGSVWGSLYADIVSCDSSRVYHSEVIRSP